MLCTAFNFLKGSNAWASIECGNAVWYLGPIQATPPGSRNEEEGGEQDCTRQVGKGDGLQRRQGEG